VTKNGSELAAIEAVLERLTPADRMLIEPRVLPRWRRRQRRLARRDELIREARRLFHGPRTLAAERLARALTVYLLINWRQEQHLEVLDEGIDGFMV
jgi:hypothetical protein